MKELEALLGFPLHVGVPNTRPVRKTMEIPQDALEKYLRGLLGTHYTGTEGFLSMKLSLQHGLQCGCPFPTLL